ncbi:MAG: phosphatidate cytidylyltransferase [Spirochaetaceae bacterium]|jgi:phosphatidate cytidylyltransferase|nr:phosphatidate cytidylyltransferase [Spirochaetaceae bacterium]
MKKLGQRLLIFFVGLPLLVCLIVFFPQKQHLALNILVVLLSSAGALEYAAMLRLKNHGIYPVEAAVFGALGPAAATVQVSFTRSGGIILAAVVFGAAWFLVSRVFSGEKDIEKALERIAGGFSVIVYPGLFLVWIIRMALFPEAAKVILIFLLIVCAGDSTAWASGMVLGRGNRGVVAASPNKSIAGFIGGFIASLLVSLGAVLFFPGIFYSAKLPPLLAGFILGLGTGLAAVLGDLSESVLKRGVNIKDSGTLIPGRGGVLDSIDSIALAAPVFYCLYRLFFF